MRVTGVSPKLDILASTIRAPWILLGNFNIVLSQDERISKVRPNQYEIDASCQCCSRNNICDVSAIGQF